MCKSSTSSSTTSRQLRDHSAPEFLSLAELFQGRRPDIPWVDASMVNQAKREETGKQGSLL